MATLEVEAARIPDRDRLVELLVEQGVDARPINEVGIEIPCDTELGPARDGLRRDALVRPDEVELVDRVTGALEELARRGNRADAHHARVDARGGRAAEGRDRLDTELRGFLA